MQLIALQSSKLSGTGDFGMTENSSSFHKRGHWLPRILMLLIIEATTGDIACATAVIIFAGRSMLTYDLGFLMDSSLSPTFLSVNSSTTLL